MSDYILRNGTAGDFTTTSTGTELNILTGVTIGNSAVLVTDAGGVRSFSTTLPPFTVSSITFSPTTNGIVGTITNDNAGTGYVGEFISSEVTQGGGTNLSNNTPTDITSISLTAGDWDLWGTVAFLTDTTTAISDLNGWISSTSATLPSGNLRSQHYNNPAVVPGIANFSFCVPFKRISINATTTVYLSVQTTFATSTLEGSGGIFARRTR